MLSMSLPLLSLAGRYKLPVIFSCGALFCNKDMNILDTHLVCISEGTLMIQFLSVISILLSEILTFIGPLS